MQSCGQELYQPRALMKTLRGHIAYMLAVDPRLGRRYQRGLMAVGVTEAPEA